MPDEGTSAAKGGVEAGVQRVPAREVWRMLAPYVGWLLVVAAGLLGLLTAAGALDSLSFDAGMATFCLAVLIGALNIQHQCGGDGRGLLLEPWATSTDGAFLYTAVMIALGLGALTLVPETSGPIQIALTVFFIAAMLLIFGNIKHYWDVRERR